MKFGIEIFIVALIVLLVLLMSKRESFYDTGYSVNVEQMFPYQAAATNCMGLYPLYPPVKGCSDCKRRTQGCWNSSLCGPDFCSCIKHNSYSDCCKSSAP